MKGLMPVKCVCVSFVNFYRENTGGILSSVVFYLVLFLLCSWLPCNLFGDPSRGEGFFNPEEIA